MSDKTLNERWHAALLAAVTRAHHPAIVLRDVLALHKPDGARGDECHADGANGYEWEHPDWPCETVGLIARALGMPMWRQCPVCHTARRAEPDGTLTTHGRLIDVHSWDANCPGAGQAAEPDRRNA